MFNKDLIKKVDNSLSSIWKVDNSLSRLWKELNNQADQHDKSQNQLQGSLTRAELRAKNENKDLKLRLESLEGFLGLNYASPDKEDEYLCGEHYYNDGVEYGLLQKLRDLLSKKK